MDIDGYWECKRCGKKGTMTTDAHGNWGSKENADFVVRHIEGCFTEEEFRQGISNEEFFVGTLRIRRG